MAERGHRPPSRPSRAERGEAPLFPSRNGEPIYCQFCPGQEFRRSRLRSADISHLLQMRYPVRCLRCGQRQLVSFTVAALSFPSSTHQPRPRRSEDFERSWSEPAERMVLRETGDEPPPQA